jgi:hypothetical protein
MSWNGGKNWESFNLNFPITPVTDLIIRHDDIIVATAGRSFWVLDDLEMIRQYKKEDNELRLYKPADALLGNWGSSMNSNSSDGTHPFTGVNRANGLVAYYLLPELPKDSEIQLEIKDANGYLVRKIRSKKDTDFQSYAGGPSGEPVLPAEPGINRFVWDLHHATLIGAPTAYIEGDYRGHKVSPGNYTLTLKAGNKEVTSNFKVLPNPLYNITDETYAEYDAFMKSAATKFNEMHTKVNALLKMRQKIDDVIKELPKSERMSSIRKNGEELIKKMNAWDEDMIQRKSKAYDDVENFPNKFTAEYIFLINSTQSSLPRVNIASKERLEELNRQWQVLNARVMDIINIDVPDYNKQLAEAGIKVIR